MGVYADESPTGFAHESLTIDATAGGIGFTAATMSPSNAPGAVAVLLTLEVAQIRYTYDGTAPTAAIGHLMEIGDRIRIEGAQNLQLFRGFRTGASSGTLKATFER